MTLKTKLLLTLFLISFLPLTVFSIFSINYTLNLLKSEIGNSLQVLTKKESDNITNLIKRKINEVKILASELQVIEAVRSSNLSYQGQSQENLRKSIDSIDKLWIADRKNYPLANQVLNNSLSESLRNFQKRSPKEYGEIFVTDNQGTTIAMTKTLSDYYQADEFWWKKSWDKGRGAVFLDDRGFDESVGSLVVGIVVPVIDEGKPIGVFKVNFKVADILDIVYSTKIGKSDFAFLVRSQGDMLAHTDSETNIDYKGHYSLSTLKFESMHSNNSGWGEDHHDGEDTIMAYSPIQLEIYKRVRNQNSLLPINGEGYLQTTWFLFTEIQRNEAFEKTNNLFYVYLTIGLVVLFMLIFISYFLAIQLFMPIKRLTNFVINHDIEKEAPLLLVQTNDEIGTLNQKFNDLTIDLHRTYQNLKSEMKEKESAELLLMESKIDLEQRVLERTKELIELNINYEKSKNAAELANQSKSEFLANMSHEIRTPMNAVIGFADILNTTEVDEQQKRYIEFIQKGGQSLLTIINDILDLSKAESGKIELIYSPVNLAELVKNIESLFILKLKEKKLNFEFTQDQKIPQYLLLDEIRMRQVLVNLVGNAIKFTETGFIRIEVRHSKKPSMYNPNDITLRISDSGIGIPSDQFSAIFKPFNQQVGQSNRKYGGTGLGLSISKRFVELMGGSIRVESELSKGSTFIIELKNIDTVSESIEKNSALFDWETDIDYKDIVFDEKKILIVDDNNENRELIKRFLWNTKLKVFSANSGYQALEQIEKIKPDLIVMDIKMPGIDGVETTKKIREMEEFRDIPVLAFTATLLDENKKKIMKEYFSGWISKPINKQKFFSQLSRFLDYRIENSENKKEKSTYSIDKETLSAKALSDVPQIIKDLQNLFEERFKEVEKNKRLSDIESLGDDLNRYGISIEFEALIQYGEKLSKSAKEFNLLEMDKLLSIFPKLTDQINSI